MLPPLQFLRHEQAQPVSRGRCRDYNRLWSCKACQEKRDIKGSGDPSMSRRLDMADSKSPLFSAPKELRRQTRVRTTTRIRIRTMNTNAPAPRSMTSLITSGFSRSSRRTKAPPRKVRGEVGTSHRFVLGSSRALLIPPHLGLDAVTLMELKDLRKTRSRRILHFGGKSLPGF
jgi:hypothetical protein